MEDPSKVEFATSWTVWSTPRGAWEMKEIFSFSTAAEFWQFFNAMKTPSECANVELAVFRSGVEPDWEKAPCCLGGRWSARLDRVASSESLDQAWLNLVLASIGESFGENVLGVAYSGKGQHSRRVSVWTRTSDSDVLETGDAIKNNLRASELSDKDIGEMLYHDFASGNKSFSVIANTGKAPRRRQSDATHESTHE